MITKNCNATDESNFYHVIVLFGHMAQPVCSFVQNKLSPVSTTVSLSDAFAYNSIKSGSVG